MQITDATAINSAASAATVLSALSTKQLSTSTAVASPPAGRMPPALRPDLLLVADELAAKFRECQTNSLGWLILSGACLRDRKNQLPRNDWVQILQSGRLPVGTRTVQMFVRIAGHPSMRDPKGVQHLPNAISILNLLAGLPESAIEQAIDSGQIHPNMSLKEAQRLTWQVPEQPAPEETQSCPPRLL